MIIQGTAIKGMTVSSSAATIAPDLEVSRSLRFNSADTAYLNRTPASASNRKTWTWSGWVKRSKLGVAYTFLFGVSNSASNASWNGLTFGSNGVADTLGFQQWTSTYRTTTQVFRDAGGWLHIVCALDTTQATSADRVKLYVNGSQITAFSTSTDPTQNSDLVINSNVLHSLGRDIQQSVNFDGYMTEINFVDGQALEPSSFGETDADTGVWNPKAYTGTYGTNGFYLKFADNSGTTSTTLGKDSSGNSNNWTPNNFSVTAGVGNDSLVDSPTSYGTDTGAGGEVRGNYATMNPLRPASYGAAILTNGSLNAAQNTTAYVSSTSTIGVSSGKWYWEVTCGVAGLVTSIGITSNLAANGFTTGIATYHYDGTKYIGATNSAYGAAYTNNDVIGFALDLDAGTLVCYKNGASQGTLTSGLSGTYYAYTTLWGSNNVNFNFGQRPFVYTAPSGFKALCTQNLPTPTIGATSTTQANDYFDVSIWTGADTGTGRSISGLQFAPDLWWSKIRSDVYSHQLYDSVRGGGPVKSLSSNDTAAEGSGNSATYGYLSSFDPTGVTYTRGSAGSGANPDGYAYYDQLSATYVAWAWRANGAGSTNTAGTITSTVSASTTSGFSIVTYTGTGANATVGHGLGVAPAMIIVKSRSVVVDWAVYHRSIGNTGAIFLNLTNTANTNIVFWNNTTPTSSVFNIGINVSVNQSADTYVAYAFAEIPGFSKFGSYTGNGSADGPFVFTDHRPAFLLVKRTDTTSNWTILDFQREGYNVDNDPLFPNLSNAEDTTDLADLLSSGFKLRSTDASVNASGGTYIYMSIASNPFKYARAR